MRPWSTVLRIPTARGPVWAKATRPGTAHEARLLAAFGAWGLQSVVPVLAVDEERGWLLLGDGGRTLRQMRPDGEGDRDLAAWQSILSTYAGLQRDLEARAEEILALGVPDGRPEAIPATLSNLTGTDVWWALVAPEERPVSDAARERLQRLAPWVAARTAELSGSGIAATIQHDDLHGGNVFVEADAIRFFDWGDSVIAHPFGSMLTTLSSVAHRLETTADDPILDRLRDAYLEAWTDVLPRRALAEVLAIALDIGRIGKAAAWARALDGLDPADMDGHGAAPALWLADLVARLETRGAI